METNELTKLLKSCHNLILTGAPGTGKTYLAQQIAAQMVLRKDEIDFKKLTDDEKAIINDRTAFVQFHPSYDYTDFVEGLRPNQQGDGIKFERTDGTFKLFCKKAIPAFSATYNQLIEDIREGRIETIPTKTKETAKLSVLGNDNIKWYSEQEENNISSNCVSKNRLEMLYNQYDSIEKLNAMKSIQTDIKAVIGGCDATYYWAVLNYVLREMQGSKPYIFIIDEINRGELSKIFGELFFSIDPGYRGEKGRVSTQYQNLIKDKTDPFKDGFYVPENVYIIGTMNDIDRSIESMDFAIRRRFAWVEVKANENTKMLSKLGDIKDKAIEVMEALNKAISGIDGLSSAYHIGASYFLKLDDYKDSDNPFKELWDYHLQGLLTEYLRGMDDAGDKLNDLKKVYEDAVAANR